MEEEVADSQCGFRCNHGCNDMIFCVRQLIEKAVEDNTKASLLFVDLRKAYDSVPREAMWMILYKYGISKKLVSIIRSFHDNMQAGISINDDIAHVVVSNGLRQGCVLAPTLFMLFFNLVLRCWHNHCQHLGIKLLCKCGGKFVGERTQVPLSSWLNEFCFADDAAVVAATKKKLVEATIELDRVVRACGLTISALKTKVLVAGNGVTPSDLEPIHVGGGAIESVSSFHYLGSIVECHDGVNAELTARVSRAATIFGTIWRSVFSNKLLCLQTKRMVYQAVVLGVLLYAVET